MKLLSTVKNALSAIRDRFTRKQTPAAKPAQYTHHDYEIGVQPHEMGAAMPVRKAKTPVADALNLPALALAVLTKQIGKRQAFALAKANCGADGVAQLADEIAAARRQWLPTPGQVRVATDGTIYEVAKDGSLRKRPDMVLVKTDVHGNPAGVAELVEVKA